MIGISAIIAVSGLLAIVLVIVCKKCSNHKYVRKVIDFCQNKKREIFWNAAIRYSLQSYLDFAVSGFLMLAISKDRTPRKLGISVSTLVVLIALPLFYLGLIYRKFKVLDAPCVKEAYGTLWGNSPTSRFEAVTHNVEFMIRRLAFAAIAVFAGL